MNKGMQLGSSRDAQAVAIVSVDKLGVCSLNERISSCRVLACALYSTSFLCVCVGL